VLFGPAQERARQFRQPLGVAEEDLVVRGAEFPLLPPLEQDVVKGRVEGAPAAQRRAQASRILRCA